MYFETPEDAAFGMKFDIDDNIVEWLDQHDIYHDNQREALSKMIRKIGWAFFHEELIEYFEDSDEYIVDADESVTYNEN